MRAFPAILWCLGLAIAAQSSRTQGPLPQGKIDPHTANKRELMERAGYVSFGPFEFGNHGTRTVLTGEIEQLLESARILWVETAHFKIGSSLPAMSAPSGRADRNKIRAELTRLARKLPKVGPATRRIGPWLRLHLLAQRMEELYARVQDWFGVTDADFPRDRSEVYHGTENRYMGEGPYLGQRGKFLVLVFEEQEHYSKYARSFIGRDTEFSQRWNYSEVGSLFFGMAAELQDRRFENDTAMHCHLVFNVTRNLIDGFRFYAYDLPVWIVDGLAHWFERRIDPRWNSVEGSGWALVVTSSEWHWDKLTPELIASYDFAPFTDVCFWRSADEFGFEEHVLIWSRLDFLMSQGKEKLAAFMSRLKVRNPGDLRAATGRALQSAYGLTLENFDLHWLDWLER